MKTLTFIAAVAAVAIGLAAPSVQAKTTCHRERPRQTSQQERVVNLTECNLPAWFKIVPDPGSGSSARRFNRAAATAKVESIVMLSPDPVYGTGSYRLPVLGQGWSMGTWTVTRSLSDDRTSEDITATHRNESVTFTIYQLYQR